MMMLNYIDKLFLGRHHTKAPLATLLIVLSIFTGVATPALTKELTRVEQYKISVLGKNLSETLTNLKANCLKRMVFTCTVSHQNRNKSDRST